MGLCKDCEYKEQGNTVKGSKVKGFIRIKTCDACKAKQEEYRIKQAEVDAEEEANLMVARKVQEMAKAELIKEGKIEEVEGKIRKKK